jgi:AcrR family transcriptional regulator
MTVATPARRGRPRNALIDAAIMDATVDELIEHGSFNLSMEAIAARAGVAKTTLYRRWPDSHELALEAFRSFESVVLDPPDASPRDQLLWLVERMRRKWNDPRYAAMMRRAAVDGTAQPELYRVSSDRLIAPHRTAMNVVIGRAIDQGLIRPGVDVNWVRQMLVSPIMASALTLKGRVTAAQVATTVDTVLRGLAP